jgi:predicted nucleic acid-binding protein
VDKNPYWSTATSGDRVGAARRQERARVAAVSQGTRQLHRLLDQAEIVEPAETPRVVPGDPEDDKLVAVALAAGADALVTNDRHLLALDPHGSLRVLRPSEFVHLWREA